jgi:hypothetical protein
VETPEFFSRLVVYIHLNPVVAGLVEDPADFVFSGHRELLGKVRDPLIDVEGVLAEFGDSVRKARKLYVRSLKGERDEEWQGERPGTLPWWGREVDRPVEPVPPATWIDELGRSTGLEREPMPPDEFVTRCCSILSVSFDEIMGRGKGRAISRARYLVAALAIERWELSAKQLGVLLASWPEAISRWANRGAEIRTTSHEFRRDFESLDRALAARGRGFPDE